MASSNLLAAIERISAYTAKFPELRSAHHFLYDLRYPSASTPKYVVMGINPGETQHDWRLSPTPTEETSRYDFHKREREGGSVPRWVREAHFYLDGAPYVQSEIFFWSSLDQKEFALRYGRLDRSPHLEFCRDLNVELIDAYDPIAVVIPGLVAATYALNFTA